jgi:signal transduction histidine kinase/ActR/RegA family two-component response regulator
VRLTHEHITANGERRTIEVAASPLFARDGALVGVIESSRDITDRVQLEAELGRARALESLGVLAGGIAHDFNNLLAVIQGNLDFVATNSSEETLSDALADAAEALRRASKLTFQLLTFAKGGAPMLRTAPIRQILEDSARFACSGAASKCAVELSRDLWQAEVDPGQFSQVIHNLVLNAVQAMPGGGQIHIAAQNVAPNAPLPPSLTPGPYVRVSVEDNGPGIAASDLQRVFEPYFTTKPGGAGLGLASSWSIVNKHGGLLTARSDVGAGARFDVFVPAATGGHRSDARATPIRTRGTGRVLAMDDEPLVRRSLERALSSLGYEVTVVKDGERALSAYRDALEAGKPYDAVLLDLTIPDGLGGAETMSQLVSMDPDVRGIVSSGYSNDPILAEWVEHGFSGVASKPYTLQTLAEVLARVLTNAPASQD